VGALGTVAIAWTLAYTRRAANAAKEAAETLPRLERAYVFLDDITGSNGQGVGLESNIAFEDGVRTDFSIECRFRNLGRTPAVLTAHRLAMAYRANGRPTHFETKLQTFPVSIVLAPKKVDAPISGVLKVSASEYADAKRGVGIIFVTGKIVYIDVFGKQRETGFCRRWCFQHRGFIEAASAKLNYRT
jgi:hypothetical protein